MRYEKDNSFADPGQKSIAKPLLEQSPKDGGVEIKIERVAADESCLNDTSVFIKNQMTEVVKPKDKFLSLFNFLFSLLNKEIFGLKLILIHYRYGQLWIDALHTFIYTYYDRKLKILLTDRTFEQRNYERTPSLKVQRLYLNLFLTF